MQISIFGLGYVGLVSAVSLAHEGHEVWGVDVNPTKVHLLQAGKSLQSLIDNAKCFETVRALRWPNGVCCPRCESFEVPKQGRDDMQPQRQRYLCQYCATL
jgi:hypothetical protein